MEAFAHPIVADALNELFRPELTDAAPADAIRITSSGRTDDLVPPVNAASGVGPLLRAMEESLRAAGREVPEYRSLVAGEYAPARRETARFAVTCYWKGEQKLGALPGVIATRTGTTGADEVVEVSFDPTRIGRDALAAQASSMSCYRGERPVDRGAALDDSNQQQYHLWLHKSWHFVPLTRLQATRVNAALVAGGSPERSLSPTQIEIHRKLCAASARDPRALDGLESLTVDRSPRGIADYTSRILDRLRRF
jgi:hypothetical protein